MTDDVSDNPVQVDVLNFFHLFEKSEFPLAVDTYQRDFVWNNDKIIQLANDLSEYSQGESPKPPYYMGTILLHRNRDKNKSFIIDGQQRLTALCVLYHQQTGILPSKCELTYSPNSAKRIRAAAKCFKKQGSQFDANIFEHISFTVISVESVDLAFTFFDTQNNRGVSLHATDLLKAYYLRNVGDQTEKLQERCAQRWERIQHGKQVLSHKRAFDHALFNQFLWRARTWTGSQVTRGNHDKLLEEFQQQALPVEGCPNTIPLYRSRHNQLATGLSLTEDGHYLIDAYVPDAGNSLDNRAESLPFAIRQPIHKGIGFFLYADKYAALLHCLVTEETASKQVGLFREVYNKLVKANSLYLQEIFLLSSLMYMDQFGDKKLWEFALWLEHALGVVRLKKQQVRYEAAQNFFKQNSLNLLDVIANSFRPEQVISHLQKHHKQEAVYANEKIERGKGVQAVYKMAVLSYFGHGNLDSLSGKSNWIHKKLEDAQYGN